MDEIFDIWPSVADFARDLGVAPSTAGSWRVRGIPPGRDPQVIEAARKRGRALTFEELHAARAAFRARPDAA